MNDQRIYSVLLAPHVSEKTALAAEMQGRHTFKVAKDASKLEVCLLYTSPSPRDGLLSRMPSSA